jgi:hypothetical protein
MFKNTNIAMFLVTSAEFMKPYETELENISVLISFRAKNCEWPFQNSGGFQTRDLQNDKHLIFKISIPVSL